MSTIYGDVEKEKKLRKTKKNVGNTMKRKEIRQKQQNTKHHIFLWKIYIVFFNRLNKNHFIS